MEKAYTRTNWEDDNAPLLDAENLNNIESGIDTLDDRVVELSKQSDEYAKKEEVAETYATKAEVSRTVERLESEFSDTYATRAEVSNVETHLSNFQELADKTYATKAEVEEISGTVTEIATEVSKGKADVILANSSGESIHLTDSTDNKAVEFALLGKATQNGTPTPSAPIDITVSGADGSVEVKSIGKNFIPYPYTESSYVDNGITWTDLGNGMVKANGTASVYTDFTFKFRKPGMALKAGTYKLSGCPKNGSTTTYYIGVNTDENPSRFATDIGNGVEFTLEKETMVGVFVGIEPGVTVNNLIFEPMISIEGGKYEPYKESTTNISTPNGLAGINGVCDGKRVYADGSGKHIQRIGKAVFDGSDDEGWSIEKGTDFNRFRISLPNTVKGDIGKRLDTFMCTHGYFHPTGSFHGTAFVYNLDSTNAVFYIYANDVTTLEEWKSRIASNPITLYYPLAEPIITDLSAEEIAELEVQTFYPTTNILNDSNCGMEVTYKADTKNYIDKIIGERITALETALINNI